MPAKLSEQLFQVGQRDLLALADRRQGDRAAILAKAQVDHRCDRKTAFGGEAHHKLLESDLVD
jgi:hypothetical protein